jgi:hypothetical protein
MKIARFVDLKACESIFSEFSTFVLRSATHYRRLYETHGEDAEELRVRTASGDSAEMTFFALSCWTMLDGDEPTRDEWNTFPDRVVAIISTPARVCAFLEETFPAGEARRHPFIFVEHKEVRYDDAVLGEITQDNIMDITVFTKRKQFARQKEYRFALPFSAVSHTIDSYIFSPNSPTAYMDTCVANPAMCTQDKERLWRILMNAQCGYGHFSRWKLCEIIANSGILLDRQPGAEH